jgi:hypothetical protein
VGPRLTSEVNSVATRRFWALFHAFPGDVQQLAMKNVAATASSITPFPPIGQSNRETSA